MQTYLKHSAPSLCKHSRLKDLGEASCGKYDSKVKISEGDFKIKKAGENQLKEKKKTTHQKPKQTKKHNFH